MSSSHQEKIPRPPNAFLIYRSFVGERLPLPPSGTRRNQIEVSKIAGEMWRNESLQVKDEFRKRAAIAKAEHATKYPDYRLRRTPKSAKGEIKKGKDAQRETSYPSGFEKSAAKNQGLHYSYALQEHSGDDLRGYLDYYDAAFLHHPSLSEESAFRCNSTTAYANHHDSGIKDYPPACNENDFFTVEDVWSTNDAQLGPQSVFGEEQEFPPALESLSFEQLMELYLSV
ncbi:hypothetical protein C0992_012484 [Termitomyces sp. T32_za158]|nr:hypothetical protein C0992_012484 [Termitomyces sp. T32_za158]